VRFNEICGNDCQFTVHFMILFVPNYNLRACMPRFEELNGTTRYHFYPHALKVQKLRKNGSSHRGLTSNHEALSSNPSTAKEEKKKILNKYRN
jgi:hypothetical protein